MVDQPIKAPEGPVRFAWFGGLLDGRRRDDAGLQQAVRRGNRIGLARLDLELDGGKFSILFEDNAVSGEVMNPAKADELFEVLNEIYAAAEPGSVESTLRCTEVYEDVSVDTLFTPAAAGMECVSRSRAIAPEDRSHAPRAAEPLIEVPRMGRRQALGLLLLLLLTFGLLTWRAGLIDRIVAHSGEQLQVETGAFGDVLDPKVVSRWGNYRVTLRRGAGWPADAAALQACIDAAETIEQGAAMRAIADGRAIWIQTRNAKGQVLDARRVELAPLLRQADAGGADDAPEVTLPGRMSARSLSLGLDSGER